MSSSPRTLDDLGEWVPGQESLPGLEVGQGDLFGQPDDTEDMTMSVDLYYTAPADDVFVEIKAAATAIWTSYTDTRYVDEKMSAIIDITNVSDNWMYMVAMFDQPNQRRLFALLRPTTVALIVEAITS